MSILIDFLCRKKLREIPIQERNCCGVVVNVVLQMRTSEDIYLCREHFHSFLYILAITKSCIVLLSLKDLVSCKNSFQITATKRIMMSWRRELSHSFLFNFRCIITFLLGNQSNLQNILPFNLLSPCRLGRKNMEQGSRPWVMVCCSCI